MCYRILLRTAALTRPLVPGAAQLLPRGGGGATRQEMGMPGGSRGWSSKSSGRAAAQPDGGDKSGHRNTGGGCSPGPLNHRRAQALRTPSPKGGQLPTGSGPAGRASLPPPRPALSPPAGRAGSTRACPAALFLIRAELARGPARPPARLRAPGAARLTFPALPAVSPGPHPPRRVSGSPATLGARRSAPRACAPPRRGQQAAPAFRRAPPEPSLCRACAARGPGRRGAGRRRLGQIQSSAERSTHSC